MNKTKPNWSKVAPYVGAWIETSSWPKTTVYPFVAPYVGAWIETQYEEALTKSA